MGIFSGVKGLGVARGVQERCADGSSAEKDDAQRADNPTDGCRLIREGHKDVQLSFCT